MADQTEIQDFQGKLVEITKTLLLRADKCLTEESTKQFLILPFLDFLGYDIYNPDSVIPEHQADFSEKYPNRVDYAICVNGVPTIALEAKAFGKKIEEDKGQLKRYFNAVKTIKLGILTDGLKYHCYADSDEPNMMDDNPFLIFDLRQISEGKVDEASFNAIVSLQRKVFDPKNVGSEAKKKLLMAACVRALEKWSDEPSDELIKLFLDEAGITTKKTSRLLEENRDLIKEAIHTFINKNIFKRLGVTQKEAIGIDESEEEPVLEQKMLVDDGIVTVEEEMYVYNYCKNRIAFLVDNEFYFQRINNIEWRDYKNLFKVYYKQERKGAILTLKLTDQGFVFSFPALDDKELITNNLVDIDTCLFESFKKRIKELG